MEEENKNNYLNNSNGQRKSNFYNEKPVNY